MAFKVMFVDDELEILKLFKLLVEPLGCDVLTFADSREAAERINRDKFDGVFVDASMPHPDGFELAKMVRASPSNFGTPIVMLTGYSDVDTMRKGFQAGITFFLGKPVNQRRLIPLLRTMRGSLLREKRRYARLPFRTVVTVQLGTRTFKSESLNLSEGGMMLEKSGGAAAGQELDLEFSVPQAVRALKAHARVVRKMPPDQLAIQFLALKIEDREAIQAFIGATIKE